MMFKKILIFLVFMHIIGDFYVQPPGMAEKKQDNIRWVYIHGGVYCGAAFILAAAILSWEMIVVWLAISASHLLIDIVKFIYVQNHIRKNEMTAQHDSNVFCVDQILHSISLLIISCVFVYKDGSIITNRWIAGFLGISGISANVLVSWILALSVVHKPANILISKILSQYRPEDKDEGRTRDNNAGRFIGTLERIIILVFIAAGQYGAIGLVLTAKSIARYDKIVKNPEFAEYYLLGTLLSTTVAVITSFLLIR